MTAAYQKPLFWPHEIDVELERRRKQAAEWVFNGLKPDRVVSDWIHEAVASVRINRLWVSSERSRSAVEPSGCRPDTGERIYCYTAHYPFLGDDWLWYVSPETESSIATGEVFRRELVLVVLAASGEEAELRFAERLDQIRALIARQCERLAEFEKGLHEYLESRLATPAGSLH